MSSSTLWAGRSARLAQWGYPPVSSQDTSSAESAPTCPGTPRTQLLCPRQGLIFTQAWESPRALLTPHLVGQGKQQQGRRKEGKATAAMVSRPDRVRTQVQGSRALTIKEDQGRPASLPPHDILASPAAAHREKDTIQFPSGTPATPIPGRGTLEGRLALQLSSCSPVAW